MFDRKLLQLFWSLVCQKIKHFLLHLIFLDVLTLYKNAKEQPSPFQQQKILVLKLRHNNA